MKAISAITHHSRMSCKTGFGFNSFKQSMLMSSHSFHRLSSFVHSNFSRNDSFDKKRLRDGEFPKKEVNPILAQMELDEFVIPTEYSNCSGCGVKFQTNSPSQLGFVEKSVIKEVVDHNAKVRSEVFKGEIPVKKRGMLDQNSQMSKFMLEQGRVNDLRNTKNKQFIEINDLEFLESIDSQSSENITVFKRKQSYSIKPIVCQRCYSLKHQRKLVDQQAALSANASATATTKDTQATTSTKSERSQQEKNISDDEDEFTIEDGSLLEINDPREFIKRSFKNVKRNSTIIMVIDATDIMGTLNLFLVETAFAQQCKVIMVVNKIDALPGQNVQMNLLKHVIRTSISNSFPDSLPLLEEIILVSSKSGDGIEKVTHYITQAKHESKQYNHSRYSKNFYVMGYANTGKSSLINAINKESRRITNQGNSSSQIGPGVYNNRTVGEEKQQKKHVPKDELNKQDQEMIRKLLGGGNLKGDDDDDGEGVLNELTTSSIPGTTVSFVKSKNTRLNVNLYDTPGVPNSHQISYYFHDKNHVKSLVIDRKITPQAVSLEHELTLYLGGLARIDHHSGIDLNVALFMSPNISIHLTKTYKANEVYIKQYNNILLPVLHPDFTEIIFARHVIDVAFDENGKCENDLEIFGLGWMSFTSTRVIKGTAQMIVYLPEGVKCALRPSIYRFDRNLMHRRIKTKPTSAKLAQRQKNENILKANLH